MRTLIQPHRAEKNATANVPFRSSVLYSGQSDELIQAWRDKDNHWRWWIGQLYSGDGHQSSASLWTVQRPHVTHNRIIYTRVQQYNIRLSLVGYNVWEPTCSCSEYITKYWKLYLHILIAKAITNLFTWWVKVINHHTSYQTVMF